MLKVVFHEDFYQVYCGDPAAAAGRIEAIVNEIEDEVEFVAAVPATDTDISAVHTTKHISNVQRNELYPIASLAAGGAIQAAELGMKNPAFALIRPPGHHASADSAWGFCYFNNMAIALASLKRKGLIESAYVLDIDLHYGDGTVNILQGKSYAKVYNVKASERDAFLDEVSLEMQACSVDIIGISAGFDNHKEDWGGLLETEDYAEIGRMVRAAARRSGGGCFALLEGGYNHTVLGANTMALIRGLGSD